MLQGADPRPRVLTRALTAPAGRARRRIPRGTPAPYVSASLAELADIQKGPSIDRAHGACAEKENVRGGERRKEHGKRAGSVRRDARGDRGDVDLEPRPLAGPGHARGTARRSARRNGARTAPGEGRHLCLRSSQRLEAARSRRRSDAASRIPSADAPERAALPSARTIRRALPLSHRTRPAARSSSDLRLDLSSDLPGHPVAVTAVPEASSPRLDAHGTRMRPVALPGSPWRNWRRARGERGPLPHRRLVSDR